MPENMEAFDLWMICQTQWRTGGFGVTGLDYNVLFKIAEKILEIEIDRALLTKIQVLEKYDLEKMLNDLVQSPDKGNEENAGIASQGQEARPKSLVRRPQ
jgi:hypothetical protein